MKQSNEQRTMRFTKSFQLLVFLSAIFLILYGCGGGGGGGSDNKAPVAEDGTLTLVMNTTQTGTLVASDEDGDDLTFEIVTNGAKGTATITDEATGAFTYTPDTDETGEDSFTFKANDGKKDSNTATISITINETNTAPVAADGTLTTNEDTAKDGTLSATDVDGDDLTFEIVTNGTRGTAVITDAATGAFTYTPNPNANGPDSFTFKANDGTEDSDTGEIKVTITSVNDNPSANAGANQTVNEGAAVALSGSGSDTADGDAVTLTWSQVGGNTANLLDAGDGTAAFTAPAVDTDTDYTFRLTASDGNGGSATDDVVITVQNAANLAATVRQSPQLVNLEEEGTTDWTAYGQVGGTPLTVIGLNGIDVIGDFSKVGGIGTLQALSDGMAAFSWTNGDGGDTADAETTGVFVTYDPPQTPGTQGYTLDITPGSIAQQTLKLYVGAYSGSGTLKLELPGATTVEKTITGPSDNPIVEEVLVDFGAADAGDALTVTYTVDNNAESANIALHAAALSPAAVDTPAINPPNGTFAENTDVVISTGTAGAAIYYTTDGSDPTRSSTRYTGQFTVTASATIKAKAFLSGFTDSDVASAPITIVDSGNAIKRARMDTPAQVVDLEDEGTTDWAAWGRNGADLTDFSSLTTGAIISNYSILPGSGAASQGANEPTAFSWTNGDNGDGQGVTANGERYAIFLPFGINQPEDTYGITLTVSPGDTTEHTLKVYVGAYKGDAKFKVSLLGAADYVQTVSAPTDDTPITKVFTIDFVPQDSADDLTITYTIGNNSLASNLSLHAASLE